MEEIRMKVKKFFVAVAAVAATIGVAGHAEARRAPPTTARGIGPVVIDRHDPTVGYMTAVYRCFGEGTLWVSVKQVEDRSRDPRLAAEHSSQIFRRHIR